MVLEKKWRKGPFKLSLGFLFRLISIFKVNTLMILNTGKIACRLKIRHVYCVTGGEASSWDYVQKLNTHLKHFVTKFQLSTINISEIFYFKAGGSPNNVAI